jgi:succinate-acetate transporter protein
VKDPKETGGFAAMTEQGVPPEKAVAKIQSTRRGWMFFAVGVLCIGMAFGFVIYTMIITKGAPSIPSMIFALLPGLPGAYFLLAGGHLISGDAMLAAEESGGIITRTAALVLKVARVKEP